MAFWDFLSRLVGGAKPSTQPRIPASATGRSPVPGAMSSDKVPAKIKVGPPPQASDFLPIGRRELLEEAAEVRRNTGWMWFGRRDMIPPASDPRTKLIDRGMPTQGLFSAEEL